jgi:alanine-glyoxylate transaminase/serine-glyoxylate transaminase/serine-pyruvate transaminase
MIAETVKAISPDTLVVLDGVCAVASEEIRFDDWSIDVVVGATQKGLGVPPGLSVTMVSPLALSVLDKRASPVGTYYASWKRWLPIMQSYEQPPAAYFATPPVQLVYALHASLSAIVDEKPSLEDRFQMHRDVSKRVKDTVESWGLSLIPLSRDAAANGMCVSATFRLPRSSEPPSDAPLPPSHLDRTAVRFPDGLGATDLLPKLMARDVVMAAGLHKDIKATYFRIGHMGATVTDPARGDVDKVLDALKASLEECGYDTESKTLSKKQTA